MNRRKYFVGVDLGQAHDFTAIATIEQITTRDEDGRREKHYRVGHLERLPLGTPYPKQAETVDKIVSALKGSPYRNGVTTIWEADVRLIVDGTGVGRPVVDMLRGMKLDPAPVTITGADTETQSDGFYRVPKRNLVSNMQVLLQTDRLRIQRELPLADTLVKELLAFKVKVTQGGHDTYGNDWRENPHDDLVLATALATYWPERHTRPDLEQLRRANGYAPPTGPR